MPHPGIVEVRGSYGPTDYGHALYNHYSPPPLNGPRCIQASSLLQRTLEAVDSSHTFSSSRKDLLKNTVLAMLRLLQALQAAAVIVADANKKSSVAKVPFSFVNNLYVEARAVKEQCLKLIPRFLLEAGDDKDAEAFGRAYIKLRAG